MAGRRHPIEEIAAKLAQANELAAKGRTHREISKALGVSIMTYHRWRKTRTQLRLNGTRVPELPQSMVEELRWENKRLRQLLADLSLEKLKLEEIVRALKNS